MDIKYRRILAGSFIVAFLIIAPILLLYTSGFSYNFKKGSLQKTGALVLETEPTGALIYLNDQLIPEKTPARLNNITPDNYEIRIEKAGYYPWSKKLSVKDQETTFAENIVLFKNIDPTMVTESDIDWWSFSPNQKFALYQTSAGLSLLDTSNKKTRLLEENMPEISSAAWSKSDTYVFVEEESTTKVFTTTQPTQTFTIEKELYTPMADNFKWSESDFSALHFQSGNKVFQMNMLLNSVSQIYELPSDETLLDYKIFNNELFVVKKLNDKTILTKYLLPQGDSPTLPKSIELKDHDYIFLDIANSKLSLMDSDDRTYLLINTSLDKIVFQKKDVQSIDLHEQNDLLLLQTSQEIAYVNLNSDNFQETNLTRYSSDLNATEWHNSSNYIIALQNNNLHYIELDDRNGHFTIEIIDDANIDDFTLDEHSEILYFVKDFKLYSTNLVD
jgi:hypothetical protein